MLDFSAMYGWLLLMAWLLANAAIVLAYRRDLTRLWREPVLRHPVLILESDDWGTGPVSQADALRDLMTVLVRHRDAQGRPPVLCLALILAVADGPAIRASGTYRRLTLAAPPFREILAALKEGEQAGVFALQLHGLEHYWPDTLMASSDKAVRDWLESGEIGMTESLPSPLQSRWVNALTLPTRPLDRNAVEVAVAEETRLFEDILGRPATVVVPPTFVWTRMVEDAWIRYGVRFIVTPGWRYTQRDARGTPAGDEGPIHCGERHGEAVYLTRTDYFEPKRGRDAAHALKALDRATGQGRACILENHRDNFLPGVSDPGASLAELDRLYTRATQAQPGLRFLTTGELGAILASGSSEWIEYSIPTRLRAWSARLRDVPRFLKMARWTGLEWMLGRLCAVLAPARAVD